MSVSIDSEPYPSLRDSKATACPETSGKQSVQINVDSLKPDADGKIRITIEEAEESKKRYRIY